MQQAINRILSLTLCAIWLLIIAQNTVAQTTQFTYQGKLSNGGAPATGSFDLNFKLLDNPAVPANQLGFVAVPNVMVTGGIFTVTLDFGACPSCFNGSARYLEIEVRPASIGMFTTLSPRQLVTSNPYAIKSLNAATADGLSVACVNCVTSSQIASASPGSSSSYIQNTTTSQPMADFNISGNGTANIFSAATHYNIGVDRVLSVAGGQNIFAGIGAGAVNTSIRNAFVGAFAGFSNTSGNGNSFFGMNAGHSNMGGTDNSFVGFAAGQFNTSGSFNSFVGRGAGNSNTQGSTNSFFGLLAGSSNTIGSDNTFVGSASNPSAGSLTNATAIGSRAFVSQDNSLVLGSINNVNASLVDTNVGIGTTAPQQRLHVVGNEILSTGFQSGFKFRDRGSTSANDDWVWYSEGNIARFFQSGLGDLLTIQTDGNVGIGIPSSGDDKLSVGGTVSLLLAEGGERPICHNGANQISDCSSSLRYKQNINPFNQGLSLIKRLRPISFNWKSTNQADLGLVAEQVAEVEPLMVTRNGKGEIEGVKYDRVGVVLINAVNEQQAQIEQQKKEIDALKVLVCLQSPTAEICRPRN